MKLRLLAFSWRECSVLSPYLEETDFECALELVSGYKTSSRTMGRNIFKLALELTNNAALRNLDFLSYSIVAFSVRLFGQINSKEDNDITRAEFNLALDDNVLPTRYNQEIVNQIFKLIDDYDRPDQGMDLESFIYYDFILELFTINNKVRPYYLSLTDFKKVSMDMLFPNKTLNEIYFIPQYNITENSYQMYQYLNISQYVGEKDFLYKFLEVESLVSTSSKKNSKLSGKFLDRNSMRKKVNRAEKVIPVNPMNSNKNNFFNVSIHINSTFQLIFNSLDTDMDGWINFYDFGSFMQIAWVFSRADEFNKGRLTAGQLAEILKSYSDYPVISHRMRKRSERFNLFDQNVYIDLLSCVQIMKIDDIVKYFTRKVDNSNVYEVELKKILIRVNMNYVPDSNLHRCLRGLDVNNLPRYEWECAFVEGMNLNLQYFEAMNNYKDAKLNNINSLNTVFYNIDPSYK
jgi:hypothetical protein